MALHDPQFVRVDEDWLSESFVYKMSMPVLTRAMDDALENVRALEKYLTADDWDLRQRGFINRGLDDWLQAMAIMVQIGTLHTDPTHEYRQPYVDLERFIVRVCERKGWATFENIRSRTKKLKAKNWTAEEIRETLARGVKLGLLVKLPPLGRSVRGGNTPRYCTSAWLKENHHLEKLPDESELNPEARKQRRNYFASLDR